MVALTTVQGPAKNINTLAPEVAITWNYDEVEYTHLKTRTIKSARKQHTCSCCKVPILPGHPYTRTTAVLDGEFEVTRQCHRPPCRSPEYFDEDQPPAGYHDDPSLEQPKGGVGEDWDYSDVPF